MPRHLQRRIYTVTVWDLVTPYPVSPETAATFDFERDGYTALAMEMWNDSLSDRTRPMPKDTFRVIDRLASFLAFVDKRQPEERRKTLRERRVEADQAEYRKRMAIEAKLRKMRGL